MEKQNDNLRFSSSNRQNFLVLVEQGNRFFDHLLSEDPIYKKLVARKKELLSSNNVLELEKVSNNIKILESVKYVMTNKLFKSSGNRKVRDSRLEELKSRLRMFSSSLKKYSWYYHYKLLENLIFKLGVETGKKESIFSFLQYENHPNPEIKKIVSEYFNEINEIEKITGVAKEELYKYKIGSLRNLIQEKATKSYDKLASDIENLKHEIGKRTIEINSDFSEDMQYTNATQLIYDICFRDGDISNLKNRQKFETAITYSAINIVKNIAYRHCQSIGMLESYNEAISCGMYGVAKAVKNYMNQIETRNLNDIDFSTFVYQYICGYIKSGLIDLNTCGTISSSSYCDLTRKKNVKIKNLKKENNVDGEEWIRISELTKNMDDDFVDNFNVTLESEYANLASESGDDDNNLWDKTCVSKDLDPSILTQARYYQELFINSVSDLFSTKDKNGNFVFDKYDKRLFEIVYGFCFKINTSSNSKKADDILQKEVALELSRMYKEDGIDKNISQPLVNSRIQALNKKIVKTIFDNKQLLQRFEIVNKAYKEYPEYMNYLSNERENKNDKLFSGENQRFNIDTMDEETFNNIQDYREERLEFSNSFKSVIEDKGFHQVSMNEEITEMFNDCF